MSNVSAAHVCSCASKACWTLRKYGAPGKPKSTKGVVNSTHQLPPASAPGFHQKRVEHVG
eukprot:9317265-Karenia_brevis.AAC.1